jgi:NADH:ubiquinone oxidoreductase subunit 6 (subunit J)
MINFYTLLLVCVTLATVLSRRTMYAILYLIVLFVLIAFVVMSWKVDFIGLIFIIVYVGAIATLFLFIVMMLGGEDWLSDSALNFESHSLAGSGFSAHWLWSWLHKVVWYVKHTVLDIVIALALGLCLIEVFASGLASNLDYWLNFSTADYVTHVWNTTYLYGVFFYNYWYIPFLLAAVVLLIAMFGSIILTTRLFLVDKKPVKVESLYAPKVNETSTLQNFMAKQQRQEQMERKYLPLQVFWSSGCLAVAIGLKSFFIVSSLTRSIYVAVWCLIYLAGSFYISYLAKKRS